MTTKERKIIENKDDTFKNFLDERLTILKGQEIRQVVTLNGELFSETREIEYFDTDLETKYQTLKGVEHLEKIFSKEEIIEAIKQSNLPFSEMTTFEKVPENIFDFENLNYFPYRKERTEKWEGQGLNRRLVSYNLIHFRLPSDVNINEIYKIALENKYDFDGLNMKNYAFYSEKENPTIFYIDTNLEYRLKSDKMEVVTLSVKVDELANKDYQAFLNHNIDYVVDYYSRCGFEYNQDKFLKELDNLKIKERFFE